MSSDGSVTHLWGDGEYRFRLRIAELRELEAKRECGGFEVYQRLADGKFRIDDIVEVLRLGLIGGGVAPVMALGLVAKHVTPTTLLKNKLVAQDVIVNAYVGDPADFVGKVMAEAATGADAPDSRHSSEPEPQWDGRSATSTSAHSGNSQRPLTDGADAMAPMSPKHLA